MIPLVLPDIGRREQSAVMAVLRSGRLAMGEQTAALEAEWADRCGVRAAVFMANGTVALEALLRCAGVGAGDEVIVPAFGFNASASAVVSVGARPVFVDVLEDFTVDPAAVEAAISPRTAAIIAVHMFGLMAAMAGLERLASRHQLLIVEDAAQAIGASFDGRAPGHAGPAMFSLYATKNVTSGEGGMVATNDELLAERLRRFRNHGSHRRFEHDSLGTNTRPTDLAAALARVQLSRLDAMQRRRARNATRLSAALGQLPGVAVPLEPAGRVHAWHHYSVRLAGRRDAVMARLAELGIGSDVYYPLPLYAQPYLEVVLTADERRPQPVTERLCSEVLSLPVRANLTSGELDEVIDGMATAVGEQAVRRASQI